jgi:NAD+ kinase
MTKIMRNEQVIHEETAVNEVVIHRWVTPSMIELKTTIDDGILQPAAARAAAKNVPSPPTAISTSQCSARLFRG